MASATIGTIRGRRPPWRRPPPAAAPNRRAALGARQVCASSTNSRAREAGRWALVDHRCAHPVALV